MRVESRVFPSFIAKRVEGIFGYSTAFCFVNNEKVVHEVFARISLLIIYKMTSSWTQRRARARTFLVRLARSISCAAVYKLWFTLKKQGKIYIYVSHLFRYIKSRGSDSRQVHYLPYRHWSVGGVRNSPHGSYTRHNFLIHRGLEFRNFIFSPNFNEVAPQRYWIRVYFFFLFRSRLARTL